LASFKARLLDGALRLSRESVAGSLLALPACRFRARWALSIKGDGLI
jgi:hypothetical protein